MIRRRKKKIAILPRAFALLLYVPAFIAGLCFTLSFTQRHFSAAAQAAGPMIIAALPAAGGTASVLERRVRKETAALIGMNEADITALFDAPPLRRAEGATQVWQYRTAGCVLDLYLQTAAVVHYEFRAREKAVLGQATPAAATFGDQAGCMDALLNTRPERPVTLAQL